MAAALEMRPLLRDRHLLTSLWHTVGPRSCSAGSTGTGGPSGPTTRPIPSSG